MPITTLFLDVGGVLLTNGWDHLARRRAVKKFNLDWAEMEERHRLTFEVHEEGKLTFEDYLSRVVFYERRAFTRAQFRRFMCEQSKPYPAMLDLIAQLKARHKLKTVVVSNESREVNAYRIRKFKLDGFVDCFISSCFVHIRKLDVWNTSIERWMYTTGTDWCRRFKVEGYYLRIAPNKPGDGPARFQNNVDVKNVSAAEDTREARHLVSPDALALVRFGLRAADDPRIRDTAKVIDALLKVETPSGVTWHRYNDDGYGEHSDGSPFDGTGIGRGWPLLTGEQGHYELAAGRHENANRLLAAMEGFANGSGLISEQVWDSPDIPEKELYFGQPSGSAMPLVWAHAEYLKLRRSLLDGRLFDLPPQTVKRYLTEKTVSPRMVWRFNNKIRWMPPGKILRIETIAPAVVHWSDDDWKTVQDVTAHATGLGIYFADLSTQSLPEGRQVKFTLFWPDANHWQGTDFAVHVGAFRRDGS